ncbi:MAG: ABC transporter substrate-binding protein [Lachnospiraceae bacterium]|nr:ABC transporter substrate-binding protein [Lachnospiraceae bacterium]
MGTKGTAALLILLTALTVTACGASSAASTATQDTDISEELTYTESMELSYAEEFCVDYYEKDFALITIAGSARYLLVPEGETAPEGLDEDIVILQQPIENIYLVASAVMDMFVSVDALDSIRFSGTQADGWYIEEAKTAMENGDILYAGKYSAPDYEQILAENCGLAIENTMIYHTPEVQEQLEKFGIPVLVDYSSYEAEPLGRTEWVKLYGLLVGAEEAAEEAFAAEIDEFAIVADAEQTGLTVAFFYITTNGEANVRQSSDYLPKMIELAGGTYIFEDLGDEDTASSTVTMTMEEFYAGAKDADYIIYNSTIDGELTSIDELLGKSSLLENFSAVQNGNVYCTSRNLYQSSMELGTITADIHRMLTGEDGELTYLYKLE